MYDVQLSAPKYASAYKSIHAAACGSCARSANSELPRFASYAVSLHNRRSTLRYCELLPCIRGMRVLARNARFFFFFAKSIDFKLMPRPRGITLAARSNFFLLTKANGVMNAGSLIKYTILHKFSSLK